MALARQCDRCKQLYIINDSQAKYTVVDKKAEQNQHEDFISKEVDLCPQCQIALNKFMNMEDY